MEFETVWSGASWRDVTAPEPQPLVQAYYERRERPSQAGAKGQHKGGRALVRAYLADGGWRTTMDVVRGTGLSRKQVQVYLAHGGTTGTIDRKVDDSVKTRPGRRSYVYRQAQA
jgi:hypothetical protein